MNNIPEKEHKAIVKKAIREANKEQKEFMDDWRKDFDEVFASCFTQYEEIELIKDIKDFIQSLLQEVGEKVVGEEFTKKGFVSNEDWNVMFGYNLKRRNDIKTLQDYGVKV